MWPERLLFPCAVLALGTSLLLQRKAASCKYKKQNDDGADAAGALKSEGLPGPGDGSCPSLQASVVHEPGALATGLLDLPDHLLGLVFAQLQWDAPSRHALYSSCRALRQSPSINEALSSNTMCLKVEEEGDHEHEGEDDGGLQQMLSQLETWPRYAPIKAVEVRVTDPEGTSILQVICCISDRTRSRLQATQSLKIMYDGEGPTAEQGTQLLAQLLACFPALTQLSLSGLRASLPHVEALASATCSATLCKLEMNELVGASAAELQAALQQLARLSALQELATELGSGEDDAVGVSPLGALSNLQKLQLWLQNCALDVGSLAGLAAGCTSLTHLELSIPEERKEEGGGVPTAVYGQAPALGPATITWPALQQLALGWCSPGYASGLFAAAFRDCPKLQSAYVSLSLAPGCAQALHSLSQQLAALPCLVERIFLLWPSPSGQPHTVGLQEGAALPAALLPLHGRIKCVATMGFALTAADVAAIAAAVGQQELEELRLGANNTGPVGALALEAVLRFPGVKKLELPKPLGQELDWEGRLVQACITAQRDMRRSQALEVCLPCPGKELGEESADAAAAALKQRWADAWAALPQPGAGPMRVTLVPY